MHTPAPWKVDAENCGGGMNIINEKGNRIAHTAESRTVDGTIIYTDEAKANAKLIASAPDLLDALKGLADLFDQHVKDADMWMTYKAARAAIERATK
jgi:hypothetical protein